MATKRKVPFLHDCVNKGDGSELFVVQPGEFYDALLLNRDRFRHAVVVLGDDINDVAKEPLVDVLDCSSFKYLVIALGTGVSLVKGVQLSEPRYEKIIVIADGTDNAEKFSKSVLDVMRLYFESLFRSGHIFSTRYVGSFEFELVPEP
ncbi:MAG: hypothetical protein JST51_15840 [Armatimonadetes bacterium]|nr:hypothetical protein [Armatimonadota bacterium]